MHSLQPQQNAQLRPRGHDENILEEAYRGRYARQRLLNFWPESSCGYHAIKRFVCIIQVERGTRVLFVHQGTLYIVEFTLDYRPRVDTFMESFKFLRPAISSIVPKLGN